MKRETLGLLICPHCHASLSCPATSEASSIQAGVLTCPTCQVTYPVINGIPHSIRQDELEGLNKTFARLYDWFSLIYSTFSRVGFYFLGTSETRARQELIDRLAPHGKVLEVSIGPGVNLPFLLNSPSVTDVYGLDISIGQLNRCNALLRRKGWSVDLFLGNAEELPFTDNSFDSVFHVGGINFFNNKKKAIDEMIRVAKPGTRLIICDENESGAQWYEKFLPGFKGAFHGQREAVSAPAELIPASMQNLNLSQLWNGFMYCLEFQKPI